MISYPVLLVKQCIEATRTSFCELVWLLTAFTVKITLITVKPPTKRTVNIYVFLRYPAVIIKLIFWSWSLQYSLLFMIQCLKPFQQYPAITYLYLVGIMRLSQAAFIAPQQILLFSCIRGNACVWILLVNNCPRQFFFQIFHNGNKLCYPVCPVLFSLSCTLWHKEFRNHYPINTTVMWCHYYPHARLPTRTNIL